MIKNILVVFVWLIFFLSPLLWPKTIDSYIAMDLLALATGLVAAFFMTTSKDIRPSISWSWLVLLAFMFPIIIQLLILDVRNPWKTWQMGLYIGSAWLIFRCAQVSSRALLESLAWSVLLGCMGNLYVLFALLQDFNLHIIPGSEIFPIWQERQTQFGGALIQKNLQALFLSIVCISLWLRALTEKEYIPWLLISIMPCAGVLATNSRSGVIVLFLGTLALILLSRAYRDSAVKLCGSICIAFLLVTYWHSCNPPSHAIAQSLIHRFETGAMQNRLFIWDMSIRLFLQHPWMGIGAGNLISYGTEAQVDTLIHHPAWTASANQNSGGNGWAHNYLLQFFLEWGIIGGIGALGLTLTILAKIRKLWAGSRLLGHGEMQASLVLLMMLMHGLVSVALLQGFFLVLFALYSSALFPLKSAKAVWSLRTAAFQLPILLLPVLFLLYLWSNFISTEIHAERAVGLPIDSPAFITSVGKGIDTPWTSRPSLEMYFANLVIHHAKPSIWVGSENFAYRFWFQHQSSLSLRYLILIAHLKNDIYTEERLINLFLHAYPDNDEARYLEHHLAEGHAAGESLDIWK